MSKREKNDLKKIENDKLEQISICGWTCHENVKQIIIQIFIRALLAKPLSY